MNPGVGWHLRRRVRGPHSLKLEGARFVGRSLRDAAARRGRRGTARGMGRGRRLMAPGDRPRIGAPGRRSRRLGRGRVVLLPDPAPPRLRDRAWLSRGGVRPPGQRAGVARSWIYTQPDILARIRASAAATAERPTTPDATALPTESRHRHNPDLAAENARLRHQLAAAHRQLHAARPRHAH